MRAYGLAFFLSTKVSLKQPIQKILRELWIIVNLFVELEMTIDHVLKQVIYHVVEGKTGILGWIYAHACLKGFVARQSLFYFSYTELIILGEVSAKMLIKHLNDL